MEIFNILMVLTCIAVVIVREVIVQRQIKEHRMTISTLLYIISEDPEKFEKVMQDIYNINVLEEME